MVRFTSLLALTASAIIISATAYADDYVITLKDNAFSPSVLTIPANQKVAITVKNMGTATAEFESGDLDREKVISAGSEIKVNIGPVAPGTYTYVNDFHRDTTGTILAK